MQKEMNKTDTILTITGSDGTGGSGVQADIRYISQLGGTAASAVTSITVQNTLGIQEFYDLPASIVRQQVEAIINDLQPQVVKIGLLRRADVVAAVASVLRHYRPRHIIYAPVLQSARGDQLVAPAVYEAIKQHILPLCTVIPQPDDRGLHGLTNQLSSAVAVYLSRGEEPEEAVAHARQLLQQQPAGPVETSGRSAELYNQFIEAVGRFCHRYDDVSFYAEQLNVTPRYLGQVTRRIGNRTPKSIIDEHITDDICTLLVTTNKSLKEIAREMGFSSQAHLSRYFKKQKGVTPSQYNK